MYKRQVVVVVVVVVVVAVLIAVGNTLTKLRSSVPYYSCCDGVARAGINNHCNGTTLIRNIKKFCTLIVNTNVIRQQLYLLTHGFALFASSSFQPPGGVSYPGSSSLRAIYYQVPDTMYCTLLYPCKPPTSPVACGWHTRMPVFYWYQVPCRTTYLYVLPWYDLLLLSTASTHHPPLAIHGRSDGCRWVVGSTTFTQL